MSTSQNIYEILERPIVTEKTTELQDENKVVFRVHREATKPQIREAVETLFGVGVVGVNTCIMPGKPKRVGLHAGRRASWKKAVVQLREGDSIDFYAPEEEELDV